MKEFCFETKGENAGVLADFRRCWEYWRSSALLLMLYLLAAPSSLKWITSLLTVWLTWWWWWWWWWWPFVNNVLLGFSTCMVTSTAFLLVPWNSNHQLIFHVKHVQRKRWDRTFWVLPFWSASFWVEEVADEFWIWRIVYVYMIILYLYFVRGIFNLCSLEIGTQHVCPNREG